MKTRFDPRHQHRIKLMQAIFAWEMDKSQPIEEVTPNQIHEADNLIVKYAPKWPLEKINKLDLAILRTALWELANKKETPTKVVLDEAIELAKEFGTESSFSFINGVLASWLKENPSHELSNQPSL